MADPLSALVIQLGAWRAHWLPGGVAAGQRGAFHFLTGQTIGYGDLVPSRLITRLISGLREWIQT